VAVETAEGSWCPSGWLGGEDIRILRIRLLDSTYLAHISCNTSSNHRIDSQATPGSSSWLRAQDRAPSRFWVTCSDGALGSHKNPACFAACVLRGCVVEYVV
jgi:hypothetical protein